MRKFILGAILLFSIFSFGQIKFDGQVLSIVDENSQGVEQTYRFKMTQEVIDTISTKKCFKNWISAMETELDKSGVPKLTSIKKEFPNTDNVLLYLRSRILIGNLMVKYKFKNPDSFKIVDNSKGFIYVSDKNRLTILQNATAQNGYGNDIATKVYYITDFETCKDTTLN